MTRLPVPAPDDVDDGWASTCSICPATRRYSGRSGSSGTQEAADAALASSTSPGTHVDATKSFPSHDAEPRRSRRTSATACCRCPQVSAAVAGAEQGPPEVPRRADVAGVRPPRLRPPRRPHPDAPPVRTGTRPEASTPDDLGPLDGVHRRHVGELERDGWLVNQTRMWLASQWTVRHGADWRDGEDRFFTHLLDGSRAANRLGWQWTIGAGTGKPYGFSRWQVEKRAPELCDGCARRDACPVEDWPDERPLVRSTDDRRLAESDPAPTAGPADVVERPATADAVWLTAESLGDDDPALAAHPELPVVFVFDDRCCRGCSSRRSGSCSSPIVWRSSPSALARGPSRRSGEVLAGRAARDDVHAGAEGAPAPGRTRRRRAAPVAVARPTHDRLDQQLLGMAPEPLSRHTAHDGSAVRGDLATRRRARPLRRHRTAEGSGREVGAAGEPAHHLRFLGDADVTEVLPDSTDAAARGNRRGRSRVRPARRAVADLAGRRCRRVGRRRPPRRCGGSAPSASASGSRDTSPSPVSPDGLGPDAARAAASTPRST